MASLFNARRKPKRITRDDQETSVDDNDNGPVVRRPNVAPKTKSKLRLSFNPGENATEVEDVTKPSKLESSSTSRDLPRYTSALNLSDRTEVERPSYNKSYLEELRNSTPSTPKDLSVYDSSATDEPESSLDVATKFGKPTKSTIPSATEIQEKKERRARLAKEQAANVGDGYIALEDYDSDGEFKPQRMQVGSYLHNEEKNTRLVREDEDIAEGFDDFVEDSGRVTMSKKGLRDQARKEREEMRGLIDDAEGSDSDESDSEIERNHAYESAQTHHGMDGLSIKSKEINRPRQPREILPIPKLTVSLSRLKDAIQQMELERVKIEKRRADIRIEKIEIKTNQDHIQKSLSEAGDELELLRRSTENHSI